MDYDELGSKGKLKIAIGQGVFSSYRKKSTDEGSCQGIKERSSNQLLIK